jgi:hypothetical protein
MKTPLLLSLLWVCAGCGSAASDAAVDEVQIGVWRGTTSDGESLELTVEELGVTRVAFGWVLPCPGEIGATSVFTTDPQPIVQGQLTFSDALGMSVDFTLVATFDSDSTASGTLQIYTHASGQFCEGMSTVTWNAAFNREGESE